MSVKIPATSRPHELDLQNLAHAVGHVLPQAYLDFVETHDGAEPESNSVELVNNETGVRSFIPVREASHLIREIDGFPCGAVPLAEDGCGNYFYLNPQTGGVHFWDHEVEGSDELLAVDLNGFLQKLAPFDASEVKLKPRQVKRVWVDPSFKPEF